MPTVRVVATTRIAPERVPHAARDFSERRERIFPAVSLKRMEVHDLGATSADVTEGTRAGPIVNWERCRYDWSEPDTVVPTVTDSNVYAVPGSSWSLTATRQDGGSRVGISWVREFRSGPRGACSAPYSGASAIASSTATRATCSRTSSSSRTAASAHSRAGSWSAISTSIASPIWCARCAPSPSITTAKARRCPPRLRQ